MSGRLSSEAPFPLCWCTFSYSSLFKQEGLSVKDPKIFYGGPSSGKILRLVKWTTICFNERNGEGGGGGWGCK